MTLDLTVEVPPRCVCCDLYLGPDARMGICVECARALAGRAMYLHCGAHNRRIKRVPAIG